jgi:hypothetical protein
MQNGLIIDYTSADFPTDCAMTIRWRIEIVVNQGNHHDLGTINSPGSTIPATKDTVRNAIRDESDGCKLM